MVGRGLCLTLEAIRRPMHGQAPGFFLIPKWVKSSKSAQPTLHRPGPFGELGPHGESPLEESLYGESPFCEFCECIA